MAYQVMATAADFVDFFKNLPLTIGSLYSNTFPYNCLYNQGAYYTADCWNMIKAGIWGDLTLPQLQGQYWYNPGKYGLQDLNGYQIIQACSEVSSDFTNIVPGEYLSTPSYDHAGLYVGEITTSAGTYNVVECTPIWANGIQFTWVDPDGTRRQRKGGTASAYWAKHGKLPWVDYTENPPEPDPDPDPDPPEPYEPLPDVPAKNINVYTVDKGLKKISIIRDNAPTDTEKTITIGQDVSSLIIDFEETS